MTTENASKRSALQTSEYINEAKEAFGKDLTSQKDWVQKTLHKLKHEEGSAPKLLTRMKSRSKSVELPPEILDSSYSADCFSQGPFGV